MAGLTTWFSDTLTNLATGLGYASKDKSASTLYGFGFLDQNQLLAAYRGDWIARKAVDIPAKDATRAWRNWQAKNDQIEKLEKVERSLNIQRKVCSALIRSRLLGGGGLILGTGTGNPESELDPTTIGLGGLKYVHVFGRYDVWVDEINRDITSMYFGEPKFYMVNRSDGTQIKVHPSRVVRFGGNEIPDYNQQFVDGWGDSVLQSIDDAVKQAGSTAANLSQIIYEAKLDIIKVPGLMEHLATKEYTDRMIKRFSSANMLKGGANALLLDTAEEWETRVQTFQGFSDIIGAYLMIASAAVDVPATRFLAQSPGGLQSTGEADIRNYYDRIKSDQKMDIQPALARLDAVLVPSALGSTPEEVYYEWASLWQQTEEQKAETSLKKAQAFKIDVDSGLHPDDALAKARQNQLIEDGVYPGFEDALDEAEMDPFEEPDPEMLALQVAAGATKGLPPRPASRSHGSQIKDYSPSQPRDPKGTSTGGQWSGESAIADYTKYGHYAVNKYLRTGEGVDANGNPVNEDILKEKIDALDKAFEDASLPAAVLYRGIKMRAAEEMIASGLKVGSVIDDPSFLSFTRNSKVADWFSNYGTGMVMEVSSPNGAKAIDVAKISKSPLGESEVIFARGSKMKVTGFNKKKRVLSLEYVK